MCRYIIFILTAVILLMAACDNPVAVEDDDGHDHAEAEGLILEQDAATVLTVQDAQVSDTLRVATGDTTGVYDVEFLDHDGNRIHGEDYDDDFSLSWNVRDEDVLALTREGRWSFMIAGLRVDTTAFALQLTHLGHPDFTTPDITVIVE